MFYYGKDLIPRVPKIPRDQNFSFSVSNIHVCTETWTLYNANIQCLQTKYILIMILLHLGINHMQSLYCMSYLERQMSSELLGTYFYNVQGCLAKLSYIFKHCGAHSMRVCPHKEAPCNSWEHYQLLYSTGNICPPQFLALA